MTSRGAPDTPRCGSGHRDARLLIRASTDEVTCLYSVSHVYHHPPLASALHPPGPPPSLLVMYPPLPPPQLVDSTGPKAV